MKQPSHQAYWQLDLFVVLMFGLMILLMQAHLSSSWETVAEIGWSALTILGMSVWVYGNRAALQDEEQQGRRNRRVLSQSAAPETRTIPLTSTQRRFLDVTQAHYKEDVGSSRD